jgi:hypothetical protein
VGSHNVTRYFADTDSFVGSEDPLIRETLRKLFWDRYRTREANYKRAALALTLAERGLPCSLPEPACTGQPEAKEGPSDYLRLNKFDGGMTFIDAQGIFRFRICVDYAVEQVDQTSPEEVAHLKDLVSHRPD